MGYEVPSGPPTPQETSRLIHRWRLRRTLWISATIIFAIVAIVATTTNWLTEALAKPLTVHDRAIPSDVVIVLGAGARKKGEHLPPQAKERIQVGVSLVKDGIAPRMIVAGGYSKKSGFVEAALMKPYAIAQGLSDDVVYEENRSTDTWENAVYSLTLMEQYGWTSATVVTSSYHTLRACTIFHKLHAAVRCLGAPLDTIPTTTLYERLTDFRSVVREYGAIVYFVFKHAV